MSLFSRKTRWQQKQELAAPARYYGDGGTIHDDTVIDVVTRNGVVTEVWFRCQMLAFRQDDVGEYRHEIVQGAPIIGVEVLDRVT